VLTSSDTALVQGLLADSAAAKHAFVHRFTVDVERTVVHLIGPDRELSDVRQEVFVQALLSIRALRDPSALKPWLMSIAKHCARRTLRNRTRRSWLRSFVDADEEARFQPIAPGVDPEARETLRVVYAALDRMPELDRITFAHRYMDGMDVPEIAAACAVSVATVKRRLQRALSRLRAQR
jgi:RNA polymerase sigma-70 factor (ECF subfamily)